MTQPAKHTPGPWAVDSEVMILANVPIQRIRDSNGREVMRVQSKHVHLVAAAPAMYEALKALVEVFPSVVKMAPYGVSMGISKIHDDAKAALTQAEGK